MTCPDCDRLFEEWNAALKKAEGLMKAAGSDRSEAQTLEIRQASLVATDARKTFEEHRRVCLRPSFI